MMFYGHVIMPSGEVLDIISHARCFCFVQQSALDMQTLILERANAVRFH